MNKSAILLTSIDTFYNIPENRATLLEILNKTGGISLRNLEWFITNYSKKNNLSYKTKDGKIFSVKLFDPFCRSSKISYTVPGTSNEIHTTVAQLNFIRWCIKNNIIEYIHDHKNALFSKQGS